MSCRSAALALALSLGALPALAAEHIVNGGFEQEDAGWDIAPVAHPWYVVTAYVSSHSGAHYAGNYCVGDDCLEQSLIEQTVFATPGQSYDLRFWLKSAPYLNGPDQGDEALRVFWNGAEVATITPATDDWRQFTVAGLVADAPGATVGFSALTDPRTFLLDDVSLQDHLIGGPGGGGGPGSGAVPEPAGWALMIAGFAGAGTALRRRRAALRPA